MSAIEDIKNELDADIRAALQKAFNAGLSVLNGWEVIFRHHAALKPIADQEANPESVALQDRPNAIAAGVSSEQSPAEEAIHQEPIPVDAQVEAAAVNAAAAATGSEAPADPNANSDGGAPSEGDAAQDASSDGKKSK